MNYVLTQKEVREIFGISKPTELKWRKQGKLPKIVKYKRNVFYKKDEVMKCFDDASAFIEKLKTVK